MIHKFKVGDEVYVKCHNSSSELVYEGIATLTGKGMSQNWLTDKTHGYEVIVSGKYGDVLRPLTKLERVLR